MLSTNLYVGTIQKSIMSNLIIDANHVELKLETVYFFHISFLRIGNFPTFLKGSSEEIDFLQFSFRSDWL